MRCSSCEPLLDRYVEGTLPPHNMARVAAHLRCVSALRGVARPSSASSMRLLATTAPVELAPNFTFAVMAEARTFTDRAHGARSRCWAVLRSISSAPGSRSARLSPCSAARAPFLAASGIRRTATNKPRRAIARRRTASAQQRRSCSVARSAFFSSTRCCSAVRSFSIAPFAAARGALRARRPYEGRIRILDRTVAIAATTALAARRSNAASITAEPTWVRCVVEPGQIVEGDLNVMLGDATIEGTVEGDVNVLGGNVINHGRITGESHAIGGDVVDAVVPWAPCAMSLRRFPATTACGGASRGTLLCSSCF